MRNTLPSPINTANVDYSLPISLEMSHMAPSNAAFPAMFAPKSDMKE